MVSAVGFLICDLEFSGHYVLFLCSGVPRHQLLVLGSGKQYLLQKVQSCRVPFSPLLSLTSPHWPQGWTCYCGACRLFPSLSGKLEVD